MSTSHPYPETEPYATGMLDVGDGNLVYWEECGNPAGTPALVLHGGPGAGCSPRHRRLFDPARFRVVLFDQHGCGRSSPHAGSPDVDLAGNTTWHLVADAERLRDHLGIDRWLLVGGSWGTTLALAYAQTHPDRVRGIVLCGVTLGRAREADWYWGGGAGHLFPEAWQRFCDPVPAERRPGDLVAAYHELLHHPDPAVRSRATAAWDGWDAATAALLPTPPGPGVDHRQPDRPDQTDQTDQTAQSDRPDRPDRPDPAAYAPARLCVHYLRHRAWLAEGQLLREAGTLAGVPGAIVQGRYDVQTPAVSAWELARAWPDADLTVVPDAGHSAFDPAMLPVFLDAITRVADAAP